MFSLEIIYAIWNTGMLVYSKLCYLSVRVTLPSKTGFIILTTSILLETWSHLFSRDLPSAIFLFLFLHQTFMLISQGLLPDLEVFTGVINLDNAKKRRGEKGLKSSVEFSFESVICSWPAKRRMTYWNFYAVGKNSKRRSLSFWRERRKSQDKRKSKGKGI